MTKTKFALIWAAIFAFLGMLFVFSDECKNGANEGILLSLGVLIPSLFPFFVLSSFIAESRCAVSIAALLNPLSRLLLGLRGICLVPVIMSILGGYPVGARSIAALFQNGELTKDEARRLSVVCCASGSGFLVTFLGVTLLESKKAGIIMLISQIISVVTLCVLSRLIYGKANENVKVNPTQETKTDFSYALVASVNSAIKSAAGMCGFVIAFSVICNVLTKGLGIEGTFGNALVAILEITNGTTLITGKVSLEVLSAFIGFGGICVHLQIFRELREVEFSKGRFYLFRLFEAVLCFVFTKIILLIFPVSQEVFSNIEAPNLTFYSGILGCVALVATSALFIISIKKKHLS